MFIEKRLPPENRVGKCEGDEEHHLPEIAVMLACADWLMAQGATKISVHPDGMHLKTDFVWHWTKARGFQKIRQLGRTQAGGEYISNGRHLTILPKPGLGDVISELDGVQIEIEAKGGCINSRHAGQLSKLRQSIQTAIGQLMCSRSTADRLIAAVPDHSETRVWAQRILPRCKKVGIEILLVSSDGSIIEFR